MVPSLPKPAPPSPRGRCSLSSSLCASPTSVAGASVRRRCAYSTPRTAGTRQGRAQLPFLTGRHGHWVCGRRRGIRSFTSRSVRGSHSGFEGLLTEFLHNLFLPISNSQETSGTFSFKSLKWIKDLRHLESSWNVGFLEIF